MLIFNFYNNKFFSDLIIRLIWFLEYWFLGQQSFQLGLKCILQILEATLAEAQLLYNYQGSPSQILKFKLSCKLIFFWKDVLSWTGIDIQQNFKVDNYIEAYTQLTRTDNFILLFEFLIEFIENLRKSFILTESVAGYY